MKMSAFASLVSLVLLVSVAPQPTHGQVQVFIEDFGGWLTANAGATRLIDFETLPDGTPSFAGVPITQDFNYTDQGVTFAPPFAVDFFGIAGNSTTGFSLDSSVNNPFERAWIVADLVVPSPAVGIFFGGGTTLSAFDAQGQLIASQQFGAPGSGHFLGFVSAIPLAHITVDRGTDAERIQAFVLNPTPEPTTLLLFGMALLPLQGRGRRRRRRAVQPELASVLKNRSADRLRDLIIATGDFFNTVQVFRQNIKGFFPASPDQSLNLTAQAFSVAAGDLSGDGFPDAVVTLNSSSQNFVILTNDGTGTLAAGAGQNLGSSLLQVVLADVDGDLDLDAAVVAADPTVGPAVKVLINDGGGTLALAHTIAVASDAKALAICALPGVGDALPDIVTALDGNDSVVVLRNDLSNQMNPGFVVDQTVNLDFLDNPRSIACAADGGFIATANFGTDSVAVLLNVAGVLQLPVAYQVGEEPLSATVVDIDADGNDDIMTVDNFDWTISILLNNGDNTLAARRLIGAGRLPTFVTSADVDANGRPDLVDLGSGQSSAPFFRITFNTCNCP